ncbi:MAG: hypothetical protein ACE5FO_04505 [Parvularculaceae bacterium]
MSDFCSREGASQLAVKIQDFWRKRGFDVSVEMRSEGFVATMRSARTDLRSDMVNGMPRRVMAAAEAG